MHHQTEDGVAAQARARAGYDRGWHPILAAVEIEPGFWRMLSDDTVYGEVRMVRRGPEVGYRATAGSGELVGYFRTLRSAAMAVHRRFLRAHGAGEFQGYPTLH
ncbi:MAG: hypothetical protein JWQ12_998 [Glaciihabitans sp.]|jgi:hypothetical protein|nr:hypothetical protein [Glaciihabitans sp.]